MHIGTDVQNCASLYLHGLAYWQAAGANYKALTHVQFPPRPISVVGGITIGYLDKPATTLQEKVPP